MNPSRLREAAAGVLYSRESTFATGLKELEFLRALALQSDRGRARICVHHDPADQLHEMLIVVARSSYLRPHRHLAKSESYHVIEGSMDIVCFDEQGTVTRVIPMSAPGGRHNFYCRLDEPVFHTLNVRSDWVVFHESTSGPFDPRLTVMAPWSPDEAADRAEIARFRDRLARALAQYGRNDPL
jgi:cupin fold WbuC family metalloprotein